MSHNMFNMLVFLMILCASTQKVLHLGMFCNTVLYSYGESDMCYMCRKDVHYKQFLRTSLTETEMWWPSFHFILFFSA